MYTRYFGLKEKPFTIAPNPNYLFMSEQHQEALAHLLYGLNSEGCIILLTGDIGTGKTTICRSLLQRLPQDTEVAVVFNPKQTITELLGSICEELGIKNIKEGSSAKALVDALNEHLLNSHARGKNTALIIDEAQNLDVEILEQLRLLTNLETDTRKLLQIVLIGQPELRTILQAPELEQINQRITTRYHLGPLCRADIDAYVEHRLAKAGIPPILKLFDQKALNYLAKTSRGIPRIINTLCDRALLGAYATNNVTVSHSIIKNARKEITQGFSSVSRPPERTGKIAALVLSALALLGGSVLLFLQFSPYSMSDLPALNRIRQEQPQQLSALTNGADNGPLAASDASRSQQPTLSEAKE
ncbi:ExeA family protein [Desulforhopalus singaporensis]|uniref:Type II secretory pathway, component ExeA (Predicted ATPase) n=1 Tax=Desulforhopalus singaporensis TaxID=91360 RepID=A0A1H0M207_9BACT|nr:AAA family ATPase [Desulforhopalus singaporensis]SDO74512.1 Type II secretory pathway, component ExeA (predicted ATPase) [Desulforhopalus singaporensis]